MDQIKIGKFISECRKKQNLTQSQLAEKLYITDRAVSKWENGRAMPDSTLMLELCKILNITVTDLLNGEIVDESSYKDSQENMVLELIKQKEEYDKELLTLENVIGVISVIIVLSFTFIASFINMEDWIRVLLIIIGFILGVVGVLVALRLEQTAGYYECTYCKHRYVPTYLSVLGAMHIGKDRFMECPSCKEKSWHKKVVSKD